MLQNQLNSLGIVRGSDMMTTEQFRAALKRFDITQEDAAALFAVNPRTARRWATGEQDVPQAVGLCFEMMRKARLSKGEVRRRVEKGRAAYAKLHAERAKPKPE